MLSLLLEESVEDAFGPSINCSESNVTFAKAHVMCSCEIAHGRRMSRRTKASLASAGTGIINLMLLVSTCVITRKACNQVYLSRSQALYTREYRI